MSAPPELKNKGFILNHPPVERGRTLIVTGLHRSGTSLVAAMLHQAGIFIGSEINDIVFEDEAIARALNSHDVDALQQIIRERNATHARWGFKYPMLCQALRPDQLNLFDQPRVIVTFRDLVAVAVRTSVSEYQEPMRTLREAVTEQSAMMDFVAGLDCPTLLLSYEKALAFPDDFITTVLSFCDIPLSDGLVARLLGVIEPNRPRYLVGARRAFEGLIEGVRDGQLYGWCWLMKLPDPVSLEVLVDDRPAVSVVAKTFRQDLLDAGIGNGRHGFFVPLSILAARPESVIRVRVAQHGVDLGRSGTRLCDFGATA